jgi:hypothetical protein
MDKNGKNSLKSIRNYVIAIFTVVIIGAVVSLILWIVYAVRRSPQSTCDDHDPTTDNVKIGDGCIFNKKPLNAICADTCLVTGIGRIAWDTNSSKLVCSGVSVGLCATDYTDCPDLLWVDQIVELAPYNYTSCGAGVCVWGLNFNGTTYAASVEALVALKGSAEGSRICKSMLSDDFEQKDCIVADLIDVDSTGTLMCGYVLENAHPNDNLLWELLGYVPPSTAARGALPDRMVSAMHRPARPHSASAVNLIVKGGKLIKAI